METSEIRASVDDAVARDSAAAPSLRGLFGSFLRLGASAFGGPAMVVYIRQMAVDKKRWLDGNSFNRGVALCQAIPGATAMQTAAYVGLRVRGVVGAAVSFVGFGLPAFGMMLLLSALYARTHNLPVIVSAFSGLRAIIVSLVANAAVSFGKTSLTRWPQALIAAVAAALFGWNASPFLIIVLASLLALVLVSDSPAELASARTCPDMPHATKTVLAIVGATVLAFIALWIFERRLFDLATLMFRIDLFAFGGGFSSVPLMFHEIVEGRRWLDGVTLLDGIVLGQVTPGPIVITATFIGYQLAGLAGGVTATVAVFLPSFLMVAATAPYFDRLRTSPRFNKIISGVLCCFVGLLLTVTIRFAQGVTWDWLHLVLGIGAFIALRLKVNVPWIVLIGAGLSIASCQ
ncbi:MAG: chromate efflux transporter [Terriglobales bacterium]